VPTAGCRCEASALIDSKESIFPIIFNQGMDMALHEAVLDLIGELLNVAINMLARKFGYSEIERKKIGKSLFWIFFGIFIAFLFFITLRYG